MNTPLTSYAAVRAAFEEWYAKAFAPELANPSRSGTAHYKTRRAIAWIAWQAAHRTFGDGDDAMASELNAEQWRANYTKHGLIT